MSSVLIVEDDPNTQLAVSAMLEELGHADVSVVKDGIEALAALNQETPPLMFLDIMMPRMDGIEVLKELRRGSAPRPVHIIVMSAYANKADREAVKQLGADQFLSKPFTLNQLEAVLGNVEPVS
jgi:two-component system alkaline phosphatase synthesis response regulator PhoP